MKLRAIYPGTFDPITNGHVDIILRASKLFSQVIVAVAASETKNPFFNLETRIELIKKSLINTSCIQVIGFEGLLIDLAKKYEADVIIRGIRSCQDFEYELQLAGMNQKLRPQMETVFLTPSTEVSFISSSLVREIARLKGDLSPFVPLPVIKAFSS